MSYNSTVRQRIRVDWTNGAEHMREKHQIEPEWADEAVADDLAVWMEPDPKSRSGRSVRVIGYSPSAALVLVVILVKDQNLNHADYWGANGWRADGSDKRIYEQTDGGSDE